MTAIEEIATASAPAALGAYSQAVKANGGPKARSEARTSAQAVGECLLHRQGELF